ncbi:MAG: type II secretion system protein, partial [Lentisphaeria bacterium]|nr:type II secretion system protein [Lentisphaeria bacterium]
MKKKQFTLIEMLVVIAIIAVLATMIGSAVFGVREKGNRTACLNNLKQLYTAANSYKDAQGSFPFVSGKHTT